MEGVDFLSFSFVPQPFSSTLEWLSVWRRIFILGGIGIFVHYRLFLTCFAADASGFHRLSSYLVWVGVKFSNAIEEELLINDASQIGSKKFDFSIE